MEIRLPNYSWFVNSIAKKGKSGNPFTGSCGTDPGTGTVSAKTVEYSVLLKTLEDDSVVFTVECSVCMPWVPGKGIEKTDTQTEQFENSEDSVAKIEVWLSETAESLLKA